MITRGSYVHKHIWYDTWGPSDFLVCKFLKVLMVLGKAIQKACRILKLNPINNTIRDFSFIIYQNYTLALNFLIIFNN